MSDIDIYLEIIGEDGQEQGTGDKLQLPVLPASIQISSPSTNETVSTIRLGEVTILKNRGLRSLTIESFFPAAPNQYPFCRTNDGFTPPKVYIETIEKARENKYPCRLSITGVGLNAFYVSIEEFGWTHGQSGDVDYSLSLKEYRPYGKRAKHMESAETMFSSDTDNADVDTQKETGQDREPTDYAVGDKVIVNGMSYGSPDGWVAMVEPTRHIMTNPYTEAQAALMMAWEHGEHSKLVNAECIIIDRTIDKVITMPTPVGDQYEVMPAPYQYCVADLKERKKIGWVARKQLRRL